MSRTYQPKKRKRAKSAGFRSKSARTLRDRRRKGRKKLSTV
ncbi:MAG TPA: 50S ribosomal protein L34 [Candidatus Paceibacterota bacterium]|nr:50S ribosomal protein L34 [Candidatus Paceibacterota bacterium]